MTRCVEAVARRAGLLGWLPVAAAVALSGCTAKKTEAPELTGPSELGLSLEMRVSPDVLTMDGVSQSTLTITVARLERRRSSRTSAVRVEVTAGGEIVDVFGRLSTKNVTTGGGRPRDADLHGAEQRAERRTAIRAPSASR